MKSNIQLKYSNYVAFSHFHGYAVNNPGYMFGTFRNYAEQVKMAGKFNEENMDYEKFVKRQIHLINEINDDKKVDYFAQLTRCYLLTEMENALYYKLARFLIIVYT